MKRYIKANSRKRRVVANDLVNTLMELTKGMWFYPMDKFSQIVYNADEIIPIIDYAACVEFGTNNGQEILIYDMQGGRKHIKYSCSMTEMFNEIVITDVWDDNGQVYACDYDAIWDELATKNSWNGEFDYDVEATTKHKCNLRRGRSIMASAWRAPNGKKYGKQTSRFPGKYLFTRKELRDMVDSGVAEDMAGTFDPMEMNYEIIGIAWNGTNGYRSGILIKDTDTGELYVGNAADATVAKL